MIVNDHRPFLCLYFLNFAPCKFYFFASTVDFGSKNALL